jgi:hypothetical protein
MQYSPGKDRQMYVETSSKCQARDFKERDAQLYVNSFILFATQTDERESSDAPVLLLLLLLLQQE